MYYCGHDNRTTYDFEQCFRLSPFSLQLHSRKLSVDKVDNTLVTRPQRRLALYGLGTFYGQKSIQKTEFISNYTLDYFHITLDIALLLGTPSGKGLYLVQTVEKLQMGPQ